MTEINVISIAKGTVKKTPFLYGMGCIMTVSWLGFLGNVADKASGMAVYVAGILMVLLFVAIMLHWISQLKRSEILIAKEGIQVNYFGTSHFFKNALVVKKGRYWDIREPGARFWRARIPCSAFPSLGEVAALVKT